MGAYLHKADKYRALLEPLSSVLPQDLPQHWADLGCGDGVFTAALAHLLPTHSSITAIDRVQQHLAPVMGNGVSVSFQQADFIHDELPPSLWHGVLMANTLHFVEDKEALIKKLERRFVATKRWLIVEYDHTIPNPWGPYPASFSSLKDLFGKLRYRTIQKIGERKSLYGGVMYAAIIANI